MVLGMNVDVAVDTHTLAPIPRGRTLPLARELDPLARLGRNESGTLGRVLSAAA